MRPIIAAVTLPILVAVGSAAAGQAPAGSSATQAKAAAPAKVNAPARPRTAASLQCSKDADAKNILGKPRKAFMSSCKKAAGKT